MVQREKIHGRFWDASSFSSGNLAPLTRVLRRPNLEGCLSLGIGTWAPPPASIFNSYVLSVTGTLQDQVLWSGTVDQYAQRL